MPEIIVFIYCLIGAILALLFAREIDDEVAFCPVKLFFMLSITLLWPFALLAVGTDFILSYKRSRRP